MTPTDLIARIEAVFNYANSNPEVPTLDFHRAATAYVATGISLFPIAADGSKEPLHRMLPVEPSEDGKPSRAARWKPFQRRLPTDQELTMWYLWAVTGGIGVVCGNISGGLEMVDFDAIELFQPWAEAVHARDPSLLGRLVVVLTPRPGIHIYFRSPAVEGNTTLAAMPIANPEPGKSAKKALIETRGEGGYCVAPPSPPGCHETGRSYWYATPRTLCDVSLITEAERAVLFDCAKTFDAMPPRRVAHPLQRPRPTIGNQRGTRPGDDYNRRGDWYTLLTRHGWTLTERDSDGIEKWCRPGKSSGTSATVNHAGIDCLHVFSSSAAPFESNVSYSKFHALTLLEYGGDVHAAARALQAQGFGGSQHAERLLPRRRPRRAY